MPSVNYTSLLSVFVCSLPPLASPAAGHVVSGGQLTAELSSVLGSGAHTVLLFLQDKVRTVSVPCPYRVRTVIPVDTNRMV